MTLIPVPSKLIKEYPRRGPMQQYRFAEATAFLCFRCGVSKRAKLQTIYKDNWSLRLCNGCYGYLLSIYKVKASTSADDERTEALATVLLSSVTRDQQREAEKLIRHSHERANQLSEKALRFIATSNYVAQSLSKMSDLDWSAATIGFCKAVEYEVIYQIIAPVRAAVNPSKLADDKRDKDFGRIARHCVGSAPAPELGTIAHFLQTAIHSKSRRESSHLLNSFFKVIQKWPRSNWILEPAGLCAALLTLTRDFRNRAAHIDELSEADYNECKDLVIGPTGVLWQLTMASEPHR